MSGQSRRQFVQGGLAVAGLGLLSGCGVVPVIWQQTAKVHRIGYLSGAAEAADPADWLGAFRAGLRDAGYVEGQSVVIEARFAQSSRPRLAEMAAELVGLPIDVLVARGTPAIQAAQRATSSIPIVMTHTSDPVELGFVASLARPAGNITGLTTQSQDLAPKRLQLLKEVAPATSRAAVFYSEDDPGIDLGIREMEAAARTLGVQLLPFPVSASGLDASLATALGERIDALAVPQATPPGGQRQSIIDFAAQHGLPAMYGAGDWVALGGLMGYGINFPDLFRHVATYVDKILKGARPADLPVERPTRFDFVVNMVTARAIGLTIPQSILQQATEVIQ